VTRKNRARALLAASAALVLAVALATGLSAWTTWNRAWTGLDESVRAVDKRSMQVRMETLRLSAQLPEGEDCDRNQLRALLSSTHYVRDLGRIRGTRIYCNTMDGSGARIELGEPSVRRGDGVLMWFKPSAIWAAQGHSALRMDPMTFVDLPYPDHTTVALLEGETGRLMAHSAPLPKPVFEAVRAQRSGQLQSAGYLVSVSRSSDGRTLDLSARPFQSVREEFMAGLSTTLSVGALVGVALFAFVMFGFARHYSLISELRRALKKRRLVAALQPIVAGPMGAASQRVVGFECLARWTREDGSEVSPALFVPMIEAAGLGSELARCMVASLVENFGATLRENPTVYVALNLASADVADPRLLDDLDRMLSEAGIPTRQIVIELTERTFEAEGLAGGLARLRQAGHHLSIDDFGTGASNASRLASFAPEMVKVDRSFLLHADSDSHAAALLPQLVAMAHGCGARVVVEGVETINQAELLAGYGEVYVQGYYWHRPMSAANASALLSKGPDELSPAPAGAVA
jgi:sensor c-di-GMP phosphodiesterase-like protein